MELREKAYAKLNISLDVGAKRDDGYHEMNMVMQTVSLCDELTVAQTDDGRISARSNLRFIPSDDRNLAVKAAKVFQAAAGSEGQGLLLTLKKRIPVGAGMAGGSSDAAAVLRALNRMHGGRFSRTELEALAGQVGSDVAFCVAGGPRLRKAGARSSKRSRRCPPARSPSASRNSPSPRRSCSASWTARRCATTRIPPGSWRRLRGASCGPSAAGCTTSLRTWATGACAPYARSRAGCWISARSAPS